MAFCPKCGSQVSDGAGFCPKCGASVAAGSAPGAISATTPAGGATVSAATGESGLQENVAGLLCYAVGWVTGLIFLLIDKRPFVKFHAAQSIVVFGALTVLRMGLAFMGGMSGIFTFGMFGLLFWCISVITFVLWILLMVKAYQHELFRLPVAANIADGIAGK